MGFEPIFYLATLRPTRWSPVGVHQQPFAPGWSCGELIHRGCRRGRAVFNQQKNYGREQYVHGLYSHDVRSSAF